MDKKMMYIVIVICIVIILASVAISSKQPRECGIENCHGLEIKCSTDIPDACTAIYQVGDFCRQFAKCKVVDGQCTFVGNEHFDVCKDCADKCTKIASSEEAFNCENNCRDLFY